MNSAPHIPRRRFLLKLATSRFLGSAGVTLARLPLLAELSEWVWQRNFHVDQTRRGNMTAVGPRLAALRCHPIG
jgi:hypothetical protein